MPTANNSYAAIFNASYSLKNASYRRVMALNQIREISLKDVQGIRHSVLHFAESAEASILPGDDDARTRHFGLFVAGSLVGVASLFVEPLAERSDLGHRLRAMAVVESSQRQGLGTELINAVIAAAAVAGSNYLWCTVRPNAISFYSRLGFKDSKEQIEMAHGTFSRMVLTIPSSPKTDS